MHGTLTSLERAIVEALEAHPSLWADEEFQRARALLCGPLASAVEDLSFEEGAHKTPTRAARSTFFLNLSKWFSGAALAAEIMSNDLHAAAAGSPKDVVAELRAARPAARRRTGAGERVSD